MRVFGTVVEPRSANLMLGVSKNLHRGTVRTKSICNDLRWAAVALYCALEETQRSPSVPALCRVDFQHLSFVIHRAPKIMRFLVDLDEHLIEMATPERIAALSDAVLPKLFLQIVDRTCSTNTALSHGRCRCRARTAGLRPNTTKEDIGYTSKPPVG